MASHVSSPYSTCVSSASTINSPLIPCNLLLFAFARGKVGMRAVPRHVLQSWHVVFGCISPIVQLEFSRLTFGERFLLSTAIWKSSGEWLEEWRAERARMFASSVVWRRRMSCDKKDQGCDFRQGKRTSRSAFRWPGVQSNIVEPQLCRTRG